MYVKNRTIVPINTNNLLQGLGMHKIAVLETELDNFVYTQKLSYVAFIVWSIGITFVKLAALAFYERIFYISPSFRTALRICYGLTLIWFLSNLPITVFICTPINKFWHVFKPGHCIDLFNWHITEGTFDVLLNLIILVLPLPVVWSLRAPPRRKALLATAFFFGYL